MTISLGRAVLELSTNSAPLTAGLTDAKQQIVGGLGGAVKQAQGLWKEHGDTVKRAGQAIAGAFKSAIDNAGQIQDAADKMGIAAESVQRLKFAAEQGGSSLDNVATAIGKMSRNLTEGKASEEIEALGLNVDALKRMSPDQAFIAIADAVGKAKDPIKAMSDAQEILGKGAMSLMPAMKAGFTEVGKAAPVMSDAMIKSADDSGDAIAAMHNRIDTMKAKALLPLLDTFTKMPSFVQTGIGAFAAFAPSLTGLASIVTMAGGPMVAFGALGTMFTVTLPAAFATILPFLGPVGIIAAAVGAVVLAWKHWDKITAFISGIYTAIKTFIVDKLIPVLAAGGPLLGPVGMVVTLWQNWGRITEIAKAVYDGVKTWLVDRFVAIVDSIKGKIDAVTGFFGNMYDKVVGNSFVPDMIKGIAGEFSKLQAVMTDPAARATDKVMGVFQALAASTRGAVSEIAGLAASVGRAWKDINETSKTWDEAIAKRKALAVSTGSAISSMLGNAAGLGDTSRQMVGLATSIGGAALATSSWATATIGGTVALGAATLGIGAAAVGAAILIKKLTDNDGRKAVENFAKDHGGFAKLQAKMLEFGDVGQRMWVELTQKVGRGNEKQAAETIAAVERMFAEHETVAQTAARKAEELNNRIVAAQEEAVAGLVTSLNGLDAEYKSLWDQVKDEAPEEVMGVAETLARERMAAIEMEQDAIQRAIEETMRTVAEGIRDSVGEVKDAVGGLLDSIPRDVGIVFHGTQAGQWPILTEAPEAPEFGSYSAGTPSANFVYFGGQR